LKKEKVGEFALRAAHAGYAQNGFNTDVLEDAYTLRYAAEAAILEFTKLLPSFLRGVERIAPPNPKNVKSDQSFAHYIVP